MYRCQSCGERFEEFEVLGQCPHCQHLSKVRCSCGHTAEGWDFVKNNDCCPKCNRPIRIAGGGSEVNIQKQQQETSRRKTALVATVVGVVVVVAGAAVFFLLL